MRRKKGRNFTSEELNRLILRHFGSYDKMSFYTGVNSRTIRAWVDYDDRKIPAWVFWFFEFVQGREAPNFIKMSDDEHKHLIKEHRRIMLGQVKEDIVGKEKIREKKKESLQTYQRDKIKGLELDVKPEYAAFVRERLERARKAKGLVNVERGNPDVDLDS